MIEIAMLPSIVRETAVMIEGMIRCMRAEPAGSSRLSMAPAIRGRSMIRKSVRNVAVTRPRIRLKAETATPPTPPAAFPSPSAICLTFA